jgi:tetratricopeptide (TPR) repeat protein
MARFDEGLAEANQADGLTPSHATVFTIARINYSMLRFDEAVAYGKRSLEKQDNLLAHFLLGFICTAQQKHDQAITEFKKAADLGNNAAALAALAYGYAMGGKKDKALKILRQLERGHKGARIVPYSIAAIYLALGHKDRALALLEQDYEVNDNWMNQLKVDPVMDPLRSDPRFQALLHMMKFKE